MHLSVDIILSSIDLKNLWKIDKTKKEKKNSFILCNIENIKDGIGGSYRLASLDRLATRQRILEQNGGYGAVSANTTTQSTIVTTNADKKNGLHRVDGITNGSSITHSVRPVYTVSTKPCKN